MCLWKRGNVGSGGAKVNKCVEAITTIGLRSEDAVRGHSSPRFGGRPGEASGLQANQERSEVGAGEGNHRALTLLTTVVDFS